MNKAKLKSYDPQARKDFIAAVIARTNLFGLSSKGGALDISASQPQGDVTVIAGQAWPVKVHSQRQLLISRIQRRPYPDPESRSLHLVQPLCGPALHGFVG